MPAAKGPSRVADAVVAYLEAMGVEVVFGIPGVHNLALFDALAHSPIRTIVTRHEQSAAYAADGYARATGRLGVCVVTTGPGVANTAAAMGEARAARSPVLEIGTQVDTRTLAGKSGRGALHESPEQLQLMSAVTVASSRARTAAEVVPAIGRAVRAAFAGRRGPVFVEIPHDVLSMPFAGKLPPAPVVARKPPDDAAVTKAVQTLARLRRPVVWAGGGVIASDASEELTQLAEMLDAPVVTTYSGKGSIPPDHPHAVNLPPHQPEVTELVARADGILIVGSDLDGMTTQGWRMPLPRPRINVNVLAEDARRNYAADLVLEADAKLALAALLDRVKPRDSESGAGRVAGVRAAADVSLRADRKLAEPYRFVQRLAKALPEDAVVLCDMAVAGYWCAGYLTVAKPRTFAYPLGWGTLGFAFPAALGVAASGRRAVAVCGDGGFLFAPGELAAAVQERLPVTVLVFNDGGYGMLRFDQDERYGTRFGVDLATPDFAELAHAFGARSRAATPAQIEEALAWSFKQRGPSLIEIAAKWTPPVTTSPRWPLKGKPEARP